MKTVLLALLLGVLLIGWAACGKPRPESEDDLGARVYQTRCVQCHLPNGLGVPGLNPPLVGTARVNGPPEPLVALVLHGLQGPNTVNGYTYNGVMPAWREVLSKEEIAAVITFIRRNWGNHAEPVGVELVETIARRTATRNTFFTSEALERFLPEK